MKKSISTPCLQSGLSIQHPKGYVAAVPGMSSMKKSISCNALADMTLDAIKYVPIHHALQCAATSVAGRDISLHEFGACIASPPELVDHRYNAIVEKPSRYDYGERAQALFDIVKRRKKAALTASQKLMGDKEPGE